MRPLSLKTDVIKKRCVFANSLETIDVLSVRLGTEHLVHPAQAREKGIIYRNLLRILLDRDRNRTLEAVRCLPARQPLLPLPHSPTPLEAAAEVGTVVEDLQLLPLPPPLPVVRCR